MSDDERSDNIHLSDRTVEQGGDDRASSEVHSDAAGKTLHPPGSGDTDQEAVDRLEQAGGGH